MLDFYYLNFIEERAGDLNIFSGEDCFETFLEGVYFDLLVFEQDLFLFFAEDLDLGTRAKVGTVTT